MGCGKPHKARPGGPVFRSTPATHHSLLITHHSASTGTVLAFDFGTKRIGVAVGDFETRLAHPLTAIAAVENRARFAAIGQLVAEWRPVLLVVGLPAHAAGAAPPRGG